MRSGCVRGSRRWPPGSPAGATWCWRRTCSTPTGRSPSWRRLRGEQPSWEKVAPRVGRLTGEVVGPDVDGYVAALRARPEVTDGPLGVVGFCMGGRIAVRAANRHPEEITACAAFHTVGLVTDEADSPHLGLSGARAEFLFAHADHDRSMGPEQVAALGAALASGGWWRRTWSCPTRRTGTPCRTPRRGTRRPMSGRSNGCATCSTARCAEPEVTRRGSGPPQTRRPRFGVASPGHCRPNAWEHDSSRQVWRGQPA